MSKMDSSDEDEVESYQYKVLIMGDGAVGKTSLINRYCRDGFAQSYKQTIGVDFFNKKIVFPGGVSATLQIWDIGGQQIGGKMLSNYVFGCHAVCFVYDSTNSESFKNVDDWYSFVRDSTKNEPKPPYLALIGNKMDLPQRQVKNEKHNLYATDHKMTPFLVSAKSGEKVNSMFQRVAADLAGVTLTKAETDVADKTVTAAIVQHPAAPVPFGTALTRVNNEEKQDDGCVLM